MRPRLRVGVISTGDELVPADETPGPGQVRDVNSPMLAALLQEYGAECVDYGIVVDDEALLREKTEEAAQSCDVRTRPAPSSAVSASCCCTASP